MNTRVKKSETVSDPLARVALKNTALFAIGGGGYYLVEVLFRGYSHWSMAICGGVCLLGISHANVRMKNQNLFLRAAAGACIITAVEFICGCIVNLSLGWRVWDYSHLPANLMGQICLPFSLIWFGLCIPICMILGGMRDKSTAQKSR